jgi:hypothetical protein
MIFAENFEIVDKWSFINSSQLVIKPIQNLKKPNVSLLFVMPQIKPNNHQRNLPFIARDDMIVIKYFLE